jgi:hypothetical protein
MTRFAVSLLAVSLLGACSYEKSTHVEAKPATTPVVAAPAGSTVVTQTPTTTTYTSPGTSTTVLR